MVRSMIAGVAGLRTHQSKLDVIGNNIANVNTWGFKSSSFNFQDSMYATSINSSAGSVLAGAAGGRNPSQVGYGVTTGSISAEFGTGAPAPSSNPLDCMIDGTGFFLVGNMVNGSFQNVADSGLYLSRVGIFRVDGNGYLVDDQRNYVYGYGLVEGTGIPEKPATEAQYKVYNATVGIPNPDDPNANGKYETTIGGVTVESASKEFEDRIAAWIKKVTAEGEMYEGYNISLKDFNNPTTGTKTVNFVFTAKVAGEDNNQNIPTVNPDWGNQPADNEMLIEGADRVPGVEAQYSNDLSTISIPVDPDTGLPYNIRSYKINEDGTIVGVDDLNRVIAIGQIALVTVENPSGLEKDSGYYYSIGANAGRTEAIKANGGAGRIMGNYLEMANVDLANEFSQMITTQRGYQANSKIITVTDQMLEELVNMKR